MMKRFFIAFTFILAIASAVAQNVTIKGQLSGFKGQKAFFVTYDEVGQRMVVDTVSLKNGKFLYTRQSDKLLQVTIYDMPDKGKKLGEDYYAIEVIALPNQPVTLQGSFYNYSLSGNSLYDRVSRINHDLFPFKKITDDAERNFRSEFKLDMTDEQKQAIQNKYYPKMKEGTRQVEAYSYDYIGKHPTDEASAYLVGNCRNLDSALNMIAENVKKSPMAECFRLRKQAYDRNKALKVQEEKIVAGVKAPDFTLKDLKGQAWTLSEQQQGRYILLDFWGSWCYWCIKALPDLKKAYGDLKARQANIEFVSIDVRDTEEKWKNAVKEHDIPWTQVRNDDRNGDNVPFNFGVPGYPTFIIISPEGQIVKKYVGSKPEMYQFLEAIK